MFINLKVFAEHSQKIPASFLNSVIHKKQEDVIPTYKVMGAYSIDFFVVMGIVSYFSFATSLALLNFIPTSMASNEANQGVYSVIPLVTFLYYSVSNFFNAGQSYGMYQLNFRTPVHAKSYLEVFKWSSYSTLMLLSFGSLAFFTKRKRSEFKSHDYLYKDLTTYKESTVISLLEEVEKMEKENSHQEYFEIAA